MDGKESITRQQEPVQLPVRTAECVDEATVMAFLAGGLSPERIGSLQQHIDRCVPCAARVKAAAPALAGLSQPQLSWGLPPEVQPGQRLSGRYDLGPVLGSGASGFVLRAHDELLGTPVAVKLLRPEYVTQPGTVQRLMRELQVARAISNPHLCRVFELELNGALPFLVMELAKHSLLEELPTTLVEPENLDARLADAEAIASGLAAMHEAEMLHRDIKPANVLRMTDDRLTLSDFGLATFAPPRSRMTVLVGTPLYMAPELLAAEPASKASDVWSLGLVLHELVLGLPPTWRRRGRARELASPALAHAREPRLAAVVELCRGCLMAMPEERPPDGRAVVERIREIRAGVRRGRSRRRLLAAGGGAAVLLGAAGFGLHRRLLKSRGTDFVPELARPPEVRFADALNLSVGASVSLIARPPGEGFLIRIPDGRRILLSEDGRDAVLSPDDRQVAFVLSPLGTYTHEEVWLLDVKTRARKRVADGGSPHWSHDGKAVYFHDHGTEALMSYLPARPDDPPQVFFANAPSAFPAYARQDKLLAFGAQQAIFVIDREAKREIFRWRVPQQPASMAVALHPDERLVAFSGYYDDPLGVWCIDMKARRALRVAPSRFAYPIWHRRYLAFNHVENDKSDISSVNLAAVEAALQTGFTESEFVGHLAEIRARPFRT